MSDLPFKNTWWSPAKIASFYALFGGLWILLSDKGLQSIIYDAETLSVFQTYKGWFFILVTATALYFLVRLAVRRTQRLEEAGIETGLRYDELVENANDCIFTLDTGGNFTSVNRAVVNLTGYRRDEILAFNFADILAPEFRDYVDRLLDPQNTQNPSAVSEVKIIRRDGSEAFLEISSRPLSLKDLDRVSVENIARDVTQRHKMQAELREASLRYETLIDAANEGIWTVDSEFKITLANRELCRITGFTQDQLVGRTLHEIFGFTGVTSNPDDVAGPHVKANDQVELKVRRADGEEIWLMVSSNPIKSNGEFQGVVYLATDITERKEAENMLRESEERFRALFELSPIGAAIIGEEGRIIECNRVGSELLGYDRDEVTNMRLSDVDVAVTQEGIIGVRHRFSGQEAGRYQFETRHRRKDGIVRDVLVATSQIKLAGISRGLASWLDITDYKQASLALQRSEERLQALYQIIAEAELDHRVRIRQILELGLREFEIENAVLGEIRDGTYRIAEASFASDNLGYRFSCGVEDTLCRETIRRNELFCVENVSESEWKNDNAYKRFEAEVYIGMPVYRSGHVFGTLSFTSRQRRETPFTGGDKEFVKLMAQWISAELTRQDSEDALRHSEEQLLQAQKLESVGRLAGGIAHDFNNMLTAINGYSDLSLSRMTPDDPLRNNLLEIKKAGERSTALTQQLLAFSRKQILKPETKNVNETVRDITALLDRLIGEDVRLETYLADDLRPTEVDNSKLSQVIVNLAVNARDAMPQGGTLRIETRNEYFDDVSQPEKDGKIGHYVLLAVRDTGVGMDEETQRQLFEPFFTTKDVGKGTGLGLATAYGFIKQSGGFITVASTPGLGSAFEIYLPSVENEAEVAPDEKRGESALAGGETILLVEDEEIVRSFACAVLESHGYNVIATASGGEALKTCEDAKLKIDLLLTDVVMPKMNGRQLWEKLSAERPGVKVIFTSGYTDDTIVRSGIREDGTNFLQKPFLIDSLTKKVREVLDAEIHISGIDRS